MFRTAVFLFVFLFSVHVNAQRSHAAKSLLAASGETNRGNDGGTDKGGGFKTVNTRRVMTIKIPEGGANGGAVVYHPKEKIYYAVQTGNKDFPMVIFDESSDILSSPDETTRIDIRGLWYNPKTKEISGNGYAQFGWFTYELDKKGFPERLNNFKTGRYQPDDHSAGVLNTDDNEVLFLNGLNIACYTTDGVDKRKNILIRIGQKEQGDGSAMNLTDFEANYNFRSIIYTGYKDAEIGFLNITKKQVELYSIKTSYMTRVVKLAIDFKPESFFNFSFSNDTYWVFDKTNRRWNGMREE
jgi:hypothetical protein